MGRHPKANALLGGLPLKSEIKTKPAQKASEKPTKQQKLAEDAAVLFGRAEKPATDAESNTEKGPVSKKALRAREKALIEKIEIVKDTAIRNQLEAEDGMTVDCTYLHEDHNAKLNTAYDYDHLIKLQSQNPFLLVKQVLLKEGPHAGHVAILIKQSHAFPLFKLPEKLIQKLLGFVIEDPSGTMNMTLKQGGSKTPISPGYSARNRLCILRVNRKIYELSLPILYNQLFHFPSTQAIASFLLQLGSHRKYLKKLRSDTYNMSSARAVFGLLRDAHAFEKLSFAHVSSNENPKTAIKNIFNDAATWLLDLDPKNPIKGIEVLSFDNSAFHMREKDEKGNISVVQWGPTEQMLFLKGLKMKLEAAWRARNEGVGMPMPVSGQKAPKKKISRFVPK